MTSDRRFICLGEEDNVLICCRAIACGESVVVGNQPRVMACAIGVGHKVARSAMKGRV